MPILVILKKPLRFVELLGLVISRNPYDFSKTAFWQNTHFPRVLHDAHSDDPKKPFCFVDSSV